MRKIPPLGVDINVGTTVNVEDIDGDGKPEEVGMFVYTNRLLVRLSKSRRLLSEPAFGASYSFTLTGGLARDELRAKVLRFEGVPQRVLAVQTGDEYKKFNKKTQFFFLNDRRLSPVPLGATRTSPIFRASAGLLGEVSSLVACRFQNQPAVVQIFGFNGGYFERRYVWQVDRFVAAEAEQVKFRELRYEPCGDGRGDLAVSELLSGRPIPASPGDPTTVPTGPPSSVSQ